MTSEFVALKAEYNEVNPRADKTRGYLSTKEIQLDSLHAAMKKLKTVYEIPLDETNRPILDKAMTDFKDKEDKLSLEVAKLKKKCEDDDELKDRYDRKRKEVEIETVKNQAQEEKLKKARIKRSETDAYLVMMARHFEACTLPAHRPISP